jgi:Flp pilus assembly protein TadD
VDAHINLGAILEKVERYSEAKSHYETACKLAPDYQRAKDKLEAVRKRVTSER